MQKKTILFDTLVGVASQFPSQSPSINCHLQNEYSQTFATRFSRKATADRSTRLRPTLFAHVCLFCSVFILHAADSTYSCKQI